MKNIEKAIELEKFYCEKSIEDTNLDLMVLLKECDYNNLEEFNLDKIKFQLSKNNFNLIKCKAKDYQVLINQAFETKKPCILQLEMDHLGITHGLNDNTLNEDFLKTQTDITQYYAPFFGGVVLIGEEDTLIYFNITKTNKELFEKYLFNNLKNFLSKYFSNVEVKRNDVLIDGKKVIGAASRGDNNFISFVMFASFKDRTELLKKLVNKENGKTPGFIDPTILSKDTFEREVISWLL